MGPRHYGPGCALPLIPIPAKWPSEKPQEKLISPAMVEAHKQTRLADPSGRTPQFLTKPATVNRELACLKSIFNKALKNGKAEHNQYVRLLTHCSRHLKPIVKLVYHTGMRQGEILGLTWDRVDLKEGFIKLRPEDTKTQEGRLVPLDQGMMEMFQAMPQGLPNVPPVFTFQGLVISYVKVGLNKAYKRAGIEDFTFHDFRHTYVTNKCIEGQHG